MEERLQKILSQAGLGSRRSCEEIIKTGRVRVNGQLAILGTKVDLEKDQISVDGKQIKTLAEHVYIMIYKPRGVITTLAKDDTRTTVRNLIDFPGFFYPVGRLDVDSEGLILLTNDGELADRLTHPKYEHEKEYKVLVARRPDEAQLAAWRRGVVLEDGFHTGSADVQFHEAAGKGAWVKVVMREGHKRQIREIGRTIGLPVVKIIRIRIGNLQLGNMKPGEWRKLDQREISSLKEKIDNMLPKKTITSKSKSI